MVIIGAGFDAGFFVVTYLTIACKPIMRILVFALTLFLLPCYVHAAIVARKPAPVLNNPIEPTVSETPLPAFSGLAPWNFDDGPHRRYEKGSSAFYSHKMVQGTVMIIGGSVMAVVGLTLIVSLLSEGSYFGKPDMFGFNSFFSFVGTALTIGGGALTFSGLLVKKRYRGKA